MTDKQFPKVTIGTGDGTGFLAEVDSSGNLKVNVAAGTITATNPSVGTTGTTAPTSATEMGIIVGGNLVGVSNSNPVPISGSISATNPSVGTTAATAPTSATEIGYINGSGNLTAPTALAGLPVSVQVQQATAVTGNITGNAQTVSATIAGYSLSLVTFHGTYAGVTVAFTLKDASGIFYPVLATALASDGSSGTSVTLGTNASGAYVVSTPGGTVLDVTSTAYGSGTAVVEITPTADQMTYNAAVGLVGSIPSGTNLIGKFGIDQTTVGTTNAVSLAQIGATTVVTGGVAGTLAVGGTNAAQASDGGNPVKIGGIAINAEQTLATNGQRQNGVVDLTGRFITFPFANKENLVSGTATTTGTSDTLVVASGGW